MSSTSVIEKLKRTHNEVGTKSSDKFPPSHRVDQSNGEHDTTISLEDEHGRIEHEGQQWRKESPYRIPTDEEKRDAKYTGECNCGRIRLFLSRDTPVASKFCHCTDCQSLHGAPLQWAAIFHKSDLHFEEGAKGLAFYHSEKKHTRHELPTKVSCAFCHAPIMDEGRNMVLMFPAIVKFPSEEAKKAFYPSMHIFYSKRVVDIPDGKTKWSGMDEKSEQLDLP
ncbi:Mss4-like protein [Pterulicium gracile]|uniref:Mss4-like protein n=1 Tax=Pterulicium gracile TaxID=1884261 RepID=A0A5C3QN30_9AGAR|nr:Mss4-like protein [Pterula gracilis]